MSKINVEVEAFFLSGALYLKAVWYPGDWDCTASGALPFGTLTALAQSWWVSTNKKLRKCEFISIDYVLLESWEVSTKDETAKVSESELVKSKNNIAEVDMKPSDLLPKTRASQQMDLLNR